MEFILQNLKLSKILVINILKLIFYYIAIQSNKFRLNKKIKENLFLKQNENIDKRDILCTNENSLEKKIINKDKISNKQIAKELKKISEGFFIKKYKKIVKKKDKIDKSNKSINTLGNNNIKKNSLINLHYKFGNHYKNLNITDRPIITQLTKGINLKQQLGINTKNSKAIKLKQNNKKLMIECRYFSNNEKYDLNEDKYYKKYKCYLSSVPNSKKKIKNKSTFSKKDKKIIMKSSKPPYTNLYTDFTSKCKNKANNNKMNIKRRFDNLSGVLLYQDNVQMAKNDSILNNIPRTQRLNSDLNSLDYKVSQENNSNYIKINNNESKKTQRKIFIKKDNLFKSIKVNKNNYFEKINNNINNNNNMKINSFMITNINPNYNNKIKYLKKSYKSKGRLKSCKFSNEKIQKIKRELITEKNKNLEERAYKKIHNINMNQSSSLTDRKNKTFFGNYIKSNKMHINGNINSNRFFINSNNWSSFINNNSEIIRNNTNSNFITNYNKVHTANKKKEKKSLYQKVMLKEEELLRKIKFKMKSKGLTSLNSNENSKSNIVFDSITNTSNRCNYNNTTSNNNFKGFKNDKKIFINNIINVNNTSENNNNVQNNVFDNNNNCCSYRLIGGDKIKSFKNKIIGTNSNITGFDYSFNNQSQRILYQNKISKINLQLKDIILNNDKSKKDSKPKNMKANIIKKNNIMKYNKINDKPLNINKEKKIVEPMHKKFESSEINVHNSQANNFLNLSNIFPGINPDSISKKFHTDKNDNDVDNNINNNNIQNNLSVASTLKPCEYYREECYKLSSYLIEFYRKNNFYPKTELSFYKYGRLLGKGAFGKVNIALHLASGRLVAIKSFNKKKLTTRRARRKIKTEIEVLCKLRSPFCTQIYDYFETDTHILIVMEYICGDLLGFMRKRSKISEPTAKIIFKQIIKGLQYIHKRKIVHRDIKLDNVLIDLTNTVKICDFGVSRILTPGDTMYEHCGTPAYIAPEIFRNEGYEGYSCDIWSAGVTLYYMLAGMQPFKGGKLEELKETILKGQYDIIKDVSNEANDLISKMLVLNPKERITIEGILKHPWLKNIDIKNRQKLNLFTNAEKGLLAKYDVNYLSSPKEELIEVFTVSNLQTKDDKDQKVVTKSDILAPYNSYSKRPDEDIYDLKIENDICRFNFKAQLSNIKYELSNNQEFDNGIIKTLYNSAKKEKNQNNNQSNEIKQSLNLSLDSMETYTCGLCDDVIKDIEELIGYKKNYLVQCLRKNEINYATATYYLMLKDELNSAY